MNWHECMKRRAMVYAALSLAALLLSLNCADITGGSSEAGNARIMGKIVSENGQPAPNTKVSMLPADYNPIVNYPLSRSIRRTTVTGPDGVFFFSNLLGGDYSIEAVEEVGGKRARILASARENQIDTAPLAILRNPGVLKIAIPDSVDRVNGYFYIPGTTISVLLRDVNGYVTIDSVPAGTVPSINYGVLNSSVQSIVRHNVSLPSGDTAVVLNPAWKYARRLYLNTTTSGANVAANVFGFPVLVRLSTANFAFAEARADGGDLRFAKVDGTPLRHEVERWDPILQQAEIWVKVDTIHGASATQFITLYWGNAAAVPSSGSSGVFDTADGFQAVWHLNEAGGNSVKDATGNHFDGTPSDTAPSQAMGAIGLAQKFNGVSNCLQMKGTATGKLNFPENGSFTVSAWVYADTLDYLYHLIVGKGNRQYFLKLKDYFGEVPMRWEFVEYHDITGWFITDAPAVQKSWKYLTGKREGNRQYFYVDGELVDSSLELRTHTIARNSGVDVSIGRYLDKPVYFSSEGYAPFAGKIDEVRIANVPHSSDWIKLCFANQNILNDALVEFR